MKPNQSQHNNTTSDYYRLYSFGLVTHFLCGSVQTTRRCQDEPDPAGGWSGEEVSRIRSGQTKPNSLLHHIGKDPSGNCGVYQRDCGQEGIEPTGHVTMYFE